MYWKAQFIVSSNRAWISSGQQFSTSADAMQYAQSVANSNYCRWRVVQWSSTQPPGMIFQ